MSEFGDLRVSGELTVPAWELSEAFVRASGPGGQNVNKVSSAVQLTWNVEASSLPADVKARFTKLYGSRITNDGRMIVEASEHRSQPIASRREFTVRVVTHTLVSAATLAFLLFIGITGYHLTEGLSWLDATLNRPMLPIPLQIPYF